MNHFGFSPISLFIILKNINAFGKMCYMSDFDLFFPKLNEVGNIRDQENSENGNTPITNFNKQ